MGNGSALSERMTDAQVEAANLKHGRALRAVLHERIRQDEEWGGPDHDDAHDIEAWRVFIDKQLDAAEDLTCTVSDALFHARMVKVAALAVACIEVLDRAKDRREFTCLNK